jgi:hypothetical protein
MRLKEITEKANRKHTPMILGKNTSWIFNTLSMIMNNNNLNMSMSSVIQTTNTIIKRSLTHIANIEMHLNNRRIP